MCICVAIDVHQNPVVVVCAQGYPSSTRIRETTGGRIAAGSPLVHDLERAHDVLVREGGLEGEAYRADVSDPVYLERMEMVNDLCSRLKRYLWHFTGMSPRNLQAYLDWCVYLFRANLARDRWDPTARVVRHILMADATYRSLGQSRHHPLSKLLDCVIKKMHQNERLHQASWSCPNPLLSLCPSTLLLRAPYVQKRTIALS